MLGGARVISQQHHTLGIITRPSIDSIFCVLTLEVVCLMDGALNGNVNNKQAGKLQSCGSCLVLLFYLF